MARKTVLKKLCKTLPLSAEIALNITQDDTIRPSFESEETESVFDLASDVTEEAVEVTNGV
jgi:recombinational DNA repair protein RecT